MEVTLTPLTAAAKGVALWLGSTVVLVAGLTGLGVMRPAFANEAEVTALGFLLGALVGAIAVWRREPAKPALAWLAIDLALAACVLVWRVPLGLAPG